MKRKSVFRMSPGTKVMLEVLAFPVFSFVVFVVCVVLLSANVDRVPSNTESHTVSNHGVTYYPVVTPKGVTLHPMYH